MMDSATLPVYVNVQSTAVNIIPMSATQRSQPHSSPSTHRASMSQCPRPVTLPALRPKWKRLAVRRLTRVYPWRTGYTSSSDGKNTKLLANIKKLAVRTENAPGAFYLRCDRTETNPSVLTALDLRGRREFANSPPGVSVRTALTTTHALEWITATLW